MIPDPDDQNLAMDHHGKLFRKRDDTWVPVQVLDPNDFRRPEW